MQSPRVTDADVSVAGGAQDVVVRPRLVGVERVDDHRRGGGGGRQEEETREQQERRRRMGERMRWCPSPPRGRRHFFCFGPPRVVESGYVVVVWWGRGAGIYNIATVARVS
jgi:hypothetical protein